MTAQFAMTFSLMIGFILGYLVCTLWNFFLECQKDWEQDNVHKG